MRRVSYIYPPAYHYRLPFHERARRLLADSDVEYRVIYCRPDALGATKRDTVDIPWGRRVGRTALPGGLTYQHALCDALRSDLVILQQENRLALNYALQLLSMVRLKKVALFGHGRNFQSRSPDGLAEKWKRAWSVRCDWWFAYTEQTRRHVEALGFPAERITVFNNAVDVSALREAASAGEEEVRAAARELGLRGRDAAVFVGGLYPDKRPDFLIEAADLVRQRLPTFEVMVIGAGPELGTLQQAAASRPWLHVTGARFGRDKALLMRSAKLFLMPGLVGLAVLDAAALSLPVVTTDYPWHSPEFAYLQHERNSHIVPDWRDPSAFAAAVVDLMGDEARRKRLGQQAGALTQTYSIDAMAQRFTAGVMAALDA